MEKWFNGVFFGESPQPDPTLTYAWPSAFLGHVSVSLLDMRYGGMLQRRLRWRQISILTLNCYNFIFLNC